MRYWKIVLHAALIAAAPLLQAATPLESQRLDLHRLLNTLTSSPPEELLLLLESGGFDTDLENWKGLLGELYTRIRSGTPSERGLALEEVTELLQEISRYKKE